MANQHTGGTFNLEVGRPVKVVAAEVEHLLNKHDMDWLGVQEASNYRRVLGKVPGYDYWVDDSTPASRQTGILVKEGLKVTRPYFRSYGDGWTTIKGSHHGPLSFPRITIQGHRVGVIHLPTPTEWHNGRLVSPPERRDDYIVGARACKHYLSLGAPRTLVADFNENPFTRGLYAPSWIAEKSGSKIAVPKSREGHGRIDYAIHRGTTVTSIFKDTDIAEGSDHEPVVFVERY